MEKLKNTFKKWGIYLLVFVGLIVGMLITPVEDVYVSPAVWYGLIGGLIFGIFSIFKWG